MIMKKYFIFAAVAAAGLLTSCSSSDDIAANDAGSIENPDARQAIRLNIGNVVDMSVRGTGTVGGVGTGTNVWSGQSINVFMFTKGTASTADVYTAVPDGTTLTSGTKYYTSATGGGEFTSDGTEVSDGTNYFSKTPGSAGDANATTLNLTPVDATTDPNNFLYDNQEMITPGSADNKIPGMGATANTNEGEAMIKDGTINYYPPAGNFDFFGYHADNAVATTAAIAKTDELWTVPFTIDGTQDLMSTKAELTQTQASEMTGATRPNDYYSAYAARKGVHPTLTFKHLLTRLQFSVKAGNDAAAGYEADVYTQAEADANNATLTGHANVGDVIYSFTSFPTGKTSADADYWSVNGYVKAIGTAGTSNEYTVVQVLKVISNNPADATTFGGKKFAVLGTDLASVTGSLALYEVTSESSPFTLGSTNGISVNNLASVTVAQYNETLDNAIHAGDPKGTGTLTAANAVYVKSIQVLSENTKGSLAVAWTADAKKDYEKIIWDAADAQPVEADRWLTLKERPQTYTMLSNAAAAAYTDLAAYANMTATEWEALINPTNPTTEQTAAKEAAENALAAVGANINSAVYNTLSAAGKAKYEADNVDNKTLVALTPTAPGIDATKSTAADRYPTKRVGESIILSPGAYAEPATATANAKGSATSLKLKVKVAQKVPTNWNQPDNRTEKEQDLDLVIAAPSAGFCQNTSYNIILTVYGLERIEVIAVVQPWDDGGNIEVGQD